MERTEIKEKVVAVLCKVLGNKAEDITDDASLRNDLGADSLDMVETLMDIEKVFGINFPPAEEDSLRDADTLKQIIDILDKKVNEF